MDAGSSLVQARVAVRLIAVDVAEKPSANGSDLLLLLDLLRHISQLPHRFAVVRSLSLECCC